MELSAYREELKLRLTGGIIDLELSDEALDGCINSAFRQVQRYCDSTRLATIPYSGAIDLTDCGVSSVSRVFRTEGYASGDGTMTTSDSHDPMYLASWQMMSSNGAGMSAMDSWVQNYAAFNTSMQIRNTISTDLIFRFDKHTNLLYVNCAFDRPSHITIEYVPKYNDVSEVVSDFWTDILCRLSLAIAKQVIGRIRKKFTQSNALWQLDTDILQEGIEEEKELQELMRKSSQLVYGID